MSIILQPFDNTWYCDKCGEKFTNETRFIFCPKCGNVLKNDWYQDSLEAIVEFLNKYTKNICENCNEEFDGDYNFCPLCSNKLKKETMFHRVEKDNSLIANWNNEETCVFNKSIFLSSPHFSREEVIKCFEYKNCLDDKLKSDFIEIGEKPPHKLNYEETFSILNIKYYNIKIHEIKFVSELSEDILKDENFNPEYELNFIYDKEYNIILKIRENLYAKINGDIIDY